MWMYCRFANIIKKDEKALSTKKKPEDNLSPGFFIRSKRVIRIQLLPVVRIHQIYRHDGYLMLRSFYISV